MYLIIIIEDNGDSEDSGGESEVTQYNSDDVSTARVV